MNSFMVTIHFVATKPTIRKSSTVLVEAAIKKHWPGAVVERSRSPAVGDLLIRTGGRVAAVEVKHLSALRMEDLLGRAALAHLTLQRADGEPVVAIIVPHVTPGAANALREFVRAHTPMLGFMLLGTDGTYEVDAAGVHAREHRIAGERTRAAPKVLFSDLNSWLLKVVLLRQTSPDVWNGPREPLRSVDELRRAGAVSRVTAFRFVRSFVDSDFLRTEPELRVVRRAELIRSWQAWYTHRHGVRTPVRWTLGRPGPTARVFARAGPTRYAVTGFAACEALGALHASYLHPEVHIDGPLAAACRQWNLERCTPADAHFTLIESPLKEAIFRGCATRKETTVVDPLQAAFDASMHAARGREQAEFVFQHVLGWSDA